MCPETQIGNYIAFPHIRINFLVALSYFEYSSKPQIYDMNLIDFLR